MNQYEIEVLWISLRVSLLATLLSAVPGILLAYLLAHYSFRGRYLISALLHFPLVLPPVVVGYFLLLVLGRHGFLGELLFEATGYSFAFRWQGAAIAAAVMGFPLLLRSAKTAFELNDLTLEEAAATLGAGPVKIFCGITLPRALPGIFAGLILAFGRSLGEFGATITFVSHLPGQTNTLPLAIYNSLQIPGSEERILRLVLISLSLAIFSVLVAEFLQSRLSKRERGARSGVK